MDGHVLLSIPKKATREVKFRDAFARFAKEECSETEAAAIAEVSARLAHLREAVLFKDDKPAMWEYIQLIEGIQHHIPAHDIPGFVWEDALCEKSQAARESSASFEVASLLFCMAYKTTETGLQQDDPVAVSKVFIEASKLLKLAEQTYANEAVYDLKKANLTFLEDYMMAQVHHVLFFHAKGKVTVRSKFIADCVTQYESLAASARVLEDLKPQFHAAAQFYAEYFKLLYWINEAEGVMNDLSDVTKVAPRIPKAIAGLRWALLLRPPLPNKSIDKAMPEFRRKLMLLVDSSRKQATALLASIQRENELVFHERVLPEAPPIQPGQLVSRFTQPAAVVPNTVEDPLKALPPAGVKAKLRGFSEQRKWFIDDTRHKTVDEQLAIEAELSELEIMGLLSLREMATGAAPTLPDALLAKVAAIRSSGTDPLQSLTTSLKTAEEVSRSCDAQLAQIESQIAEAERKDEENCKKFGPRWKLSLNLAEIAEFSNSKKVVADMKQHTSEAKEVAAAAQADMEDPRQKELLALLSNTTDQLENMLSDCARPALQEQEAANTKLDDLAACASVLDSCRESLKRQLAELEAEGTVDADSIVAELQSVDLADGVLARQFEGLQARAASMADTTQEMKGVLAQLRAKRDEMFAGGPALDAQGQAPAAQPATEFIDKLDKAASAYIMLANQVEQAALAFTNVVSDCEEVSKYLGTLVQGIDFACADLDVLVASENDRALAEKLHAEDQMASNDRALAEKLHAEDQSESAKLRADAERENQAKLEQLLREEAAAAGSKPAGGSYCAPAGCADSASPYGTQCQQQPHANMAFPGVPYRPQASAPAAPPAAHYGQPLANPPYYHGRPLCRYPYRAPPRA
ncbi:hypothetical protein DIPPA_22136 [Diplonema papillatum]|nr:hypothetical protein DIPPA_22136 [Diplonema papillatum]